MKAGCSSAGLFLFLAVEGRAHFGFGVDAEGVGDAIDVIEIGDDFDGVQDVAVAEAVFAKGIDVLLADGVGSARHEVGEFGQGFAAGRQFCMYVVVLDVFGQLGVAAFDTEILSVSLDSIETVVGPGDHDGQQFALAPGKR